MCARRLLALLCSGMAFVMFSAQALAGGPVKLRYKFKQGESLNYKMVVEQGMQISSEMLPGSALKLSMTMDTEMYQKTTKLEKRAATIELGFTKFKAEMSQGGPKMAVPGTEGITKVRMSMRMTDRGEMSEPKLANPDEIDAQLAQIADTMRSSITQNPVVFPEKALSPGDTWSIEQDLPAAVPGADDMKMKLKANFKLVAIEQLKGKQCAKINAEVKLSLHGEGNQGGIPTRIDMEGTGKGLNVFAIEEGQMLSSEAKFSVAGNAVASHQGQKVGTNLKMDVNLKVDLVGAGSTPKPIKK